jgi:DNA-binding MarR family transcriptional regulator
MGLHTKISVGDIGRLLTLVSDLAEQSGCSTSEAVEQIERLLTPQATGELGRQRTRLADFVARMRRLRVRRNELIGAPLFRDPAWDMLLELFVAQENGRKVTVSSLCYASGVPPTTALRQIARMEEHGLVDRYGDHSDLRRSYVRLTDCATARMSKVAEMLLAQTPPPEPVDFASAGD